MKIGLFLLKFILDSGNWIETEGRDTRGQVFITTSRPRRKLVIVAFNLNFVVTLSVCRQEKKEMKEVQSLSVLRQIRSNEL